MSEHKPIGKTARGLAVYPVTHPSYRHLEHTQVVGAELPHLAKLAQAAHPHYRAVDHEEASVMHHARRNLHAARAHEAASGAMSKALPSEVEAYLPASDSKLAWVYEGASPAMTPEDAATAIRAATIGWTRQDHLEMGAVQHHLAVALSDDPGRQALCSAAAFMHVSAAGVEPGALLGKSLHPKVLRPKAGTKPAQIGKTRSGKPIYNMFTHPAHASFTTADHVDHISAMEAHNKRDKMNKSQGEGSRGGKGEGSRGGKVIGHTKSGKPIYGSRSALYRDVKGEYWNGGRMLLNADAVRRSHPEHSADDHEVAGEMHGGSAKSFDTLAGHAEAAGDDAKSEKYRKISQRHKVIQYSHQLAAHDMDNGKKLMTKSDTLGILKQILSKADKVANSRGGKVPTEFKLNTRPSGADLETFMHKSEAVSILEYFLSKSGEGSRGGKVIGHTKSGKPIYAGTHKVYSRSRSALASDTHGFEGHSNGHEMADHVEHAHPSYDEHDHMQAASAHYKASKEFEHRGHSLTYGNDKQVAQGNKLLQAAKMHSDIGESHSFAAHRKQGWSAYQRGADSKKSMSKSGEGSRGGKVIGHTKSGKPIYASGHETYNSPANKKGQSISDSIEMPKGGYTGSNHHIVTAVKAKHPGWTKQDHLDAAEAHGKGGFSLSVGDAHKFTANAMNRREAQHKERSDRQARNAVTQKEHEGYVENQKMHKSEAVGILEGFLAKSGEGSRGGKVIGHTKSGKPIYEKNAASHASHAPWSSSDHKEAAQAHEAESGRQKQAMAAVFKNKNSGIEERVAAQRAVRRHVQAAEGHAAMAGKIDARKKRAAEQVDAHMQRQKLSDARDGVRQVRARRETENKKMSKSDIMGMPVDLVDLQDSSVGGGHVDSMGGSHDLFMQQAELANNPTMWASIATVPEN